MTIEFTKDMIIIGKWNKKVWQRLFHFIWGKTNGAPRLFLKLGGGEK